MRGMLGVFIFTRIPLPNPLGIILGIGVLIAMAAALIYPILSAVRAGDTARLRGYGRAFGRFMVRVIGIIAMFVGLAGLLLLLR